MKIDNNINKNTFKKGIPIFEIVNPNKKLPKFVINNKINNNKNNNFIIKKNNDDKNKNDIDNNLKIKINKNFVSNITINNDIFKIKNNFINKKDKKINYNIFSFKKDTKKYNKKNNNNIYNVNNIKNNENKNNDNSYQNINNNIDLDKNKIYKIQIKKNISNEKEGYLIGVDSIQNKNEIIFEINNNILYLNEYIIIKNQKIGFHFHKNESGNIFNYFPIPFQTIPDIIEYKCCLKDCESKAYYNFKDKKFEIIKDNSNSNEFHYFSNYNNYIFKKIIEFMKLNSDIKDLQFILK